MRHRLSLFVFCLFSLICFVHVGCNESTITSGGDNAGDNGTGGSPEDSAGPTAAFFSVGANIANLLIDLEFLPGQNGESIVITQDGKVYYLRDDFTPLPQSAVISVTYNADERGLLNVAADPLYSSNHYVYFYYTVPGSSPDINRVEQYEVNVDVSAGSFSLSNPQPIIEFEKSGGASNHNGGSLVFMNQDHLAIGVGDGGDANHAQDSDSPLGKIHRVIPDRTGVGGYSIPNGQDIGEPDNVSAVNPSIYSLGVRNPFTLVVDEDGDLFMGDVGAGSVEELNCVYYAGENYGWPVCEGPCSPSNPSFQNPIHYYLHGDDSFNDEDPEDNPNFAYSIMLSAYYLGDAYAGQLNGKIIYNDFYAGWVRLLTLNAFDQVIGDQHLGHMEGMTGLHLNPVDGMLYGVSLTQSNQVFRLDLN